MTLKQKEQEIIDEFSMYEDWMEKYEYIIDLGKELEDIGTENKVAENLIKGCQSQVWLVARKEGEEVKFLADSDAIITKGLVALVIRVLSGSSAKEILESDLQFVNEIGLKEHLSPNRSNGLMSMIKQMKFYALSMSNNENK